MVDRTSRPPPSSRITRVEPPLGTTIPWPPVGRFSSTPEYAATSRKIAAIPRTILHLLVMFFLLLDREERLSIIDTLRAEVAMFTLEFRYFLQKRLIPYTLPAASEISSAVSSGVATQNRRSD